MLLYNTNFRRFYGLLTVQLILVGVFAGTTSLVQANSGTPPEYRYEGPPDGTSVVAGENTTLYAQGYSDLGLSWAWLSTNETGTWRNYTNLWSEWQASESNPIIDGDNVFGSGYVTEDSKILKVADSYYIFTSSGSTQSVMEIYMMNSFSLAGPWSLMNNSSPIILRGTSGWDLSNLRVSSVMYYDGTYYLYYMGTDASGMQHIGVATTSDAEFPNGWTKYSGNPILSPTGIGWESRGIYSLDLERIGPAGNEWYGHYSATDQTGPGGGYWSIGICYGASPYGPFTRHTNNPILQRGIGQWDNLGLPRTDLVVVGNTIYGAFEAASTTSPWDFQVGEYSGEINGDILSVVFSKNPNNPIIAGDAGSATQSANPCWWYENETRYMLAGGGIPSPYRWRYIDLFASSLAKQHGSPLEMHDVAHSWTWSNFTWSSSGVPPGTTIQWMIYFVDTEGNVNSTAIHSFAVEAPEYDFVDLDTSDVDDSTSKGTHSNFLYEKACNSNYDTLTEEMVGDFGSMSYRKNLTINHNYVDGDQTNFPILIDLYETDLHSKVQTSGNDIAFTDSIGSKLDHEIEYFNRNYNETHAHLVAWIRANLSATLDTTICMIYGNPTVGSQENPPGVWDGNYQGVWHLSEDASGIGTTDLYKDSTLNNNDGDDQVSATGKAGRIDGGQEFDGANDYIKVDGSPGLGLDDNALLEAWIQPSLLSGYQVILRKAPNNGLMDFPEENYGVFLHGDEIYFEFYSGGTYRYHETTSANLQTGNWYYLVVVYDNVNDRVRIYLNGNNILDQAQTNALVDYADTHLRIGDRYVDNGQHFHGYIDEVRISNATRSASWTNTTYQNTHSMLNFLSIGSEELPTSPANCVLDLEIQWTNVNYTRTYEELCIKTGVFSGSEDIQVRIWNSTGKSWHWLMNLTANQANNASIISYLTESTLTIQFLGGIEAGDTNQDSWDIGCSLIRTWSYQPILSLNPASRVCRMYGETYEIRVDAANASSAEDFRFEIHYNSTLLNIIAISWNAWSSGTYTVDEVNGIVSGYTLGGPISADTTLVTLTFNATFHRMWKSLPDWVNNQSGAVYVQWANLSYASGPDLGYVRGGLNQINVGPDVAYTYCPIRGDLNNDGTVDIFDIAQIALHYNQEDPEYNLVYDPIVDIFDVVTVATNFGTTYVPPSP